MPAATSIARPDGHCSCGGGCPRCRAAGAALRIGRADAAEEIEAEETASRVMGGTVQARPRPPAPTPSVSAADAAFEPLRTPGQPLDGVTRRVMEGHLRRDLGAVRLHQGPAAAAGAAALQAEAYTLGDHIVVGPHAAPPHTAAGLHLLAHELAHVGQSGASTTIRRADRDYRIEHLPLDAASQTSSIFFDRGSATIPITELPKIVAMATPPGRDLTLHGFASEDASAADRVTRVDDRIAAVDAALVAAGHTGLRTPVPHPDSGVGAFDYRSMRSVQVLPTPTGMTSAPTTVNPCDLPGSETATGTELTDCETSFTTSFPTARDVVNAAERDIVTSPTAAANLVVSRFFSGVPRADLDDNVTAIAAQVRQLDTAHRCHTSCDGGCDRPAYNSGTGLGATGSMMTLCPDFVSAGLAFRINTLIHEASHANPVESIEDLAYSNTRLIPFLLATESRRNTDSYVLLMRLVHSAGSMPVGPATADTPSGMTGTGPGSDTEQTERAVAWLESWLNYGDFDTSILYATIQSSLLAGAWVTVDTNEFNVETMHRLSIAFAPDLTDPGPDRSARTTPPAPLPTETDKLRVAAIHDRFSELYAAINQRPLTVTRGGAGSFDNWGMSITRPYLTQAVTVSPTFFTLSRVEQVKRLALLMVRSHLDISVGFESKYVHALDLIHTHRRLGP